jgi:hypothetical protein
MGGRHLKRAGRPDRTVRPHPRHRAAGAAGEPEEADAGEETGSDVLPDAAAPREQSFFGGISTAALVLAATGLVVLGMVGRWVSDAEQAGSAIPTATIEVPGADAAQSPSPGPGQPPGQPATSPPDRAGQPPGTPTQTISSDGEISRVLVVVPESDCRRFVQTHQELPTLTISVANLCQ